MGGDSTETIIHLVSGGTGGTMGAILTCPFEVVKTRLQSSNSGFVSSPPSSSNGGKSHPSIKKKFNFSLRNSSKSVFASLGNGNVRIVQDLHSVQPPHSSSLPHIVRWSSTSANLCKPHLPEMGINPNPWRCLKFIVKYEGVMGLFKGLGPNLVGVAPARAIYFGAYSTSKRKINSTLPKRNRDTPFVHVISAGTAGFAASTATNPIWLVKTRLQLDRRVGSKYSGVRKCIAQTYSQNGIFGFWRGVTASYWGITETAIHFVIYEYLKGRLIAYQKNQAPLNSSDSKSLFDFAGFMICGACSKTCATIVAYPHEVARTRLREEGSKYRSFWQTLATVYREEGRAGLYRGLLTQLIRQIPNTAIMMATYELTVYFMSKWLKGSVNGTVASKISSSETSCSQTGGGGSSAEVISIQHKNSS